MICQFCQKEPNLSTIEEAVRMNVRRYWCGNCMAEYLMWEGDETINSMSLYTQRGEKTYRWTTTSTGRAILYYVPVMFTNQHFSRCEVLFSLGPEDNHPKITPDNVADKIKTMLIFL